MIRQSFHTGFSRPNNCYDPVTTALVISAVGVGISGYSAYEASRQKMPEAPPMPKTPNPQDSLAQAQQDADERRKVIAAAGGKTDITSGGGMLKPADIKLHTLLGS